MAGVTPGVTVNEKDAIAFNGNPASLEGTSLPHYDPPPTYTPGNGAPSNSTSTTTLASSRRERGVNAPLLREGSANEDRGEYYDEEDADEVPLWRRGPPVMDDIAIPTLSRHAPPSPTARLVPSITSPSAEESQQSGYFASLPRRPPSCNGACVAK